VLCCPVVSSSGQVDTLRVYFLGGQSNMDGYGLVSDLPESLQDSLGGVWMYHGNPALDNAAKADGRGLWSQLAPGHGVGFSTDGTTNSYSDRFGLELTFSTRMRELLPDQPFVLIKYSRGGTSIDSAAAGDFGSWDPDFIGATGVNQYDHALATIESALAAGDVNGDGRADRLVPAGILWMQGESDAVFSAEIALRYSANLKRLMDLLRAAFRTDDLPVVIGRIADSGQDSDGRVWDHGDIVRGLQAGFVETDACARLVTSTDNYDFSDPWHYDSAGYLDLGRRFADAMADMTKPRLEDQEKDGGGH
jgi:hypothetical protein